MNPDGWIYEGSVDHRREEPVPHGFGYRLCMLYVDVDRLADLFRGRFFWSVSRPNIAWFRRSDYLGPPERSLAECVRELVAERLGRTLRGPVRLLTQFRYFGIGMNPLSLYYCFDEQDCLEAVVAEVSNTPWNQQHWYVLDARGRNSGTVFAETAKAFHVSPFLGMAYDYLFEFNTPGESLVVRVANRDQQSPKKRTIFRASLKLQRRPLDGLGLARVLIRYPLMTLQIYAAIYFQAWRLWRKGASYFPHPGHPPPSMGMPQEPSPGAPIATETSNDTLVSAREP